MDSATGVLLVTVCVSVGLLVLLFCLLRWMYRRARLRLIRAGRLDPMAHLQQRHANVLYYTQTCFDVGVAYLERGERVVSQEGGPTHWERTRRRLLKHLRKATRSCGLAIEAAEAQRLNSKSLVDLQLGIGQQRHTCSGCRRQQEEQLRFFCPLLQAQRSAQMEEDGSFGDPTNR